MLHMAQVLMPSGCIQYSLSEDAGIPGVIWVAERWRDKAAQAAYFACEHIGQFNQFMKHMPISAAHIVNYDGQDDGQWLMRVGSPLVS